VVAVEGEEAAAGPVAAADQFSSAGQPSTFATAPRPTQRRWTRESRP
jgi:hypothetical protein